MSHSLHRSLALIVSFTLLVGCTRGARRTPTEVGTPSPTEVGTPSPIPTAGVYVGANTLGFGLITVIPNGSNSTSDPQAIAAVAASGARYMRVPIEWAVAEAQKGQMSFQTANDQNIQAIEAAGLRVFPTLYVGRGWMNGNPPDARNGGSRSFPPGDLSEQWSEEYGYSQGYYAFVYQFFTHYQGHFDYVAIENEANSKLFWGGTVEEYVRLAQTAYKAIKAADPSVQVTDSGVVSSVWGICAAADYIQAGTLTREAALQFAVDYYLAESRTGKERVLTPADAESNLNRAVVQEQCRRLTYMLDHLKGSLDAVNFHFYEDYQVLHFVVDWIAWRTGRAGYTPAVLTNELGQRGPDLAWAAGPEQAKQVFKKLVTGLSLGLEAMVWFSSDTINTDAPAPDKVGLFNNGGAQRPAARTYKLVAETIGTEYHFQQALASGPALYHYVFANQQGQPVLEAIWTEGDTPTLTLTAPAGATQAIVTDYAGQTQMLMVSGGTVNLGLTDAPVFVMWK